MIHKHLSRLIIAASLVALGLWMEIVGLLDVQLILEFARGYSQHWWMIVILILAQALLFTFALAGSLFLWVAAPLYPPPLAAFILACGGTLGGLGAYYFSGFLTEDWKRKIEASHSYKLLHAQDNFFALFAMRVFPGFPHALVNYSAGILNAKISHFVVAAMLGIGIKSLIYARVIYGASSSLSPRVLLDLPTIGPLLGLSMFSIVGTLIFYRLGKNKRR